MQRDQREQLVAVNEDAVAVHGEHAVAVAVEGEADRVTALHDRLGQRLDVGRTAAGVDVAPVRAHADRRDARAEALEDLRGDAVGRAMRAVEQHVQSVEAQRLEAVVQVAFVVLGSAGKSPDTTNRSGPQSLVLEVLLDRSFALV